MVDLSPRGCATRWDCPMVWRKAPCGPPRCGVQRGVQRCVVHVWDREVAPLGKLPVWSSMLLRVVACVRGAGVFIPAGHRCNMGLEVSG